MLCKVQEIQGYDVSATDGELGDIYDLYFDDQLWSVRYLVVDTGRWLPGRKVLLAPEAIADQPKVESRKIPVSLTKEQIKESPGIAIDLPVSRQKEIELRSYYDWPLYWDAYPAGLGAGPLLYPPPPEEELDSDKEDRAEAASGDPNLRSAREVIGYRIAAKDGEIGHVEDLLVDSDDWVVRYVVVDTRNWLPGRKVLVSPAWVREIGWAERQVHMDLDRDSIEQSPDFDPSCPIDRSYEALLHRHYGRPNYWS